MRTRLVLLGVSLGVLGVFGCTRNNPAFESGGEGGSETRESEAGTLGESESGSGQGGGESCSLSPGTDLQITLPGAPTCSNDIVEDFDSWVLVFEPGDNSSHVQVAAGCESGCPEESCTSDTLFDFIVDPLPLAELVPLQTCLHVVGHRATPSNVDDCEFDTVLVEEWTGQVAEPILLARAAPGIVLPPVEGAYPELAGFDPVAEKVVENCTCDMFPEECCGDRVPTIYAFEDDPMLPAVPMGGVVESLTLDGRDYKFEALNAYEPGACSDDPRAESWALTIVQ